ncbi:MAG TPA: hypothetical protein VM223_12830 [Planctomycetota bacterium]|nr:hypothetical protein [Planctomycetota bacterium]
MEGKICYHAVPICTGAIVLLMSLNSCRVTGRPDKEAADLYNGTPAQRTPYDGKYEKVRKYLREAATRIRYTPEDDNIDYWQLPQETEALGTGDCEDMAIWLYDKLRRAGVTGIRFCIGKHVQDSSIMHAWVLWFDGSKTFVLDPSVSGELQNVKDIPSRLYTPYYSYDGDRKWIHKRPEKKTG